MEITVANTAPVLEQDAQLERSGGGAHEFLLVDAKQAVKRTDGRNRGFADAYRADLFGLDQHHVEDAVELVSQCGCRHPSCGATSRDHDPANLFHGDDLLTTSAGSAIEFVDQHGPDLPSPGVVDKTQDSAGL